MSLIKSNIEEWRRHEDNSALDAEYWYEQYKQQVSYLERLRSENRRLEKAIEASTRRTLGDNRETPSLH